MSYDFIVLFPINPKALKSYRSAFSVSGAKDDCSDAMLLEEYVRLHRDKLKAWEPDTIEERLDVIAKAKALKPPKSAWL